MPGLRVLQELRPVGPELKFPKQPSLEQLQWNSNGKTTKRSKISDLSLSVLFVSTENSKASRPVCTAGSPHLRLGIFWTEDMLTTPSAPGTRTVRSMHRVPY
jgi:hypothetical protein